MAPAGSDTSWSTQQLTEFLAMVSSVPERDTAAREAIERAAEALEAELGAVVEDGRVIASVGFPAGRVPEAELTALAGRDEGPVDLPGVGACHAAAVPLEGPVNGRMLLARIGDERFSRQDVNLLRGMARVLALTLRILSLLDEERSARAEAQRHADDNARLLASLDERRRLLEALARIQASIAKRARLPEVLQAIVEGAASLVDCDQVALWLLDANDPAWMMHVASRGIDDDTLRTMRRIPVGQGAAGRAMAEGRLAVVEDYAKAADAIPDMVASQTRVAVGVPVHEHGTPVGSLVVGSRSRGSFTAGECEMLLSYAEHASLALAAAKTVDTMRQAFNDPLTGLANRALLLDRLEHALARVQRESSTIALLFLDLDRFKLVNDSLGHVAGDALLVAVAERLGGCLRRAETAARLGGDEFAILLDGEASAADGVRVARRIEEALREPFVIADREVFVTASIGVAAGRSSAEDLLRDADVAMYRAKGRGKGRYEVFEQSMHTEVMERLELEADIQRGLKRGEFLLHYQPLVDLAQERTVGVEALVRWQHPERGLVPPGDFISVTEDTGFIVELGAWVLAEACRQAAIWQAEVASQPPLAVSVNVSGRQLQHPSLIDDVRAALEESRLPARSLILELTETVIMQDSEASATRLHELKELGVRVAVDDFGTGYSSLRYLQRFPIDVLKVAKPFVDELAEADDRAILAGAIVDLSRNLRLGAIAEGIETEEQAERLRRLGCGYGQGFLFCRPLERDAMTSRLIEEASGPVGRYPALGRSGFDVR